MNRRPEISPSEEPEEAPVPEPPPTKRRGGWIWALILVIFGGVSTLGAGLLVVLGMVGESSDDRPAQTEETEAEAVVDAAAEVRHVDDAARPEEPAPSTDAAAEVEPAAVVQEPAPEPVVIEEPPAPAPKPAPSKPRPMLTRAQVVDGVYFDAEQAVRALEFINTADEPALRAAGVYGRGVNIILSQRPFDSLKTFGTTPQIGEKTVQAVHRAASQL